MSRPSHLERTAAEPRHAGLHHVRLRSIRAINSRIRLLTLSLPYALHFLPGQWLDVHVPGISKAGGFTITSPPSQALSKPAAHHDFTQQPSTSPYLELAVQSSPTNPPAAWLWQAEDKILDADLRIRVGGKFNWPPPNIDVHSIDELVLIAGGVGINPLISILAHLDDQSALASASQEASPLPGRITLLYASKLDSSGLGGVLFYPRIKKIMSLHPRWRCRIFLTGTDSTGGSVPSHMPLDDPEHSKRRMTEADVLDSLSSAQSRSRTVAYVCGPANMTDHFVNFLQSLDGMLPERVLCEKWW